MSNRVEISAFCGKMEGRCGKFARGLSVVSQTIPGKTEKWHIQCVWACGKGKTTNLTLSDIPNVGCNSKV